MPFWVCKLIEPGKAERQGKMSNDNEALRECSVCESRVSGYYVAVGKAKAVCKHCVESLHITSNLLLGTVRMVPSGQGCITYEGRIQPPPRAIYLEQGGSAKVEVLSDVTDVSGTREIRVRLAEKADDDSLFAYMPVGYVWTAKATALTGAHWSLEYA